MENEVILREFMRRVWNGKEYQSVPEFVSRQYTIFLDNDDPWQGATIDNDEYIRRLHHSFDPFPDMHFDIQSAISDSDSVAITWIMTGTNLGAIGGFPPTGKSIRTEGVTIYRFSGGKVCGHYQVFDRTKVARQLGFIA